MSHNVLLICGFKGDVFFLLNFLTLEAVGGFSFLHLPAFDHLVPMMGLAQVEGLKYPYLHEFRPSCFCFLSS